jgi:hypothetical protein
VAAAYRADNAGLGLFLLIVLPVASSAPPPERHRLASVGLLRELAKRLNAAPALSISSPPRRAGALACQLARRQLERHQRLTLPQAPASSGPVSSAAKALKRRDESGRPCHGELTERYRPGDVCRVFQGAVLQILQVGAREEWRSVALCIYGVLTPEPLITTLSPRTSQPCSRERKLMPRRLVLSEPGWAISAGTARSTMPPTAMRSMMAAAA